MIQSISKQIDNPNITKKDLGKFFLFWLFLVLIVVGTKLLENFIFNDNPLIVDALDIDVPVQFPFSVLQLKVNYSMLFALPIIAFVTLRAFRSELKISHSIFFSTLLIISANLGNSGFYGGYFNTLTYGDVTYYQEALKINDWMHWLSTFNENHASMFSHSASHPPGPTLLMHLLEPDTATFLYLITSLTNLTVFLVCLKMLKVNNQRIAWILLFYSALPSFNIYGVLCADAMFLHFFNLFLLGICAYHNAKYRWLSYIYIPVSLIITGFLSFAVTFLFAVGGIYALYLLFAKRDKNFLLIYLISLLSFGIFYYSFYEILDFNWLEAFFSASASENPNGFELFNHPLNYIFTRIEGIWEFLIFAGIAFTIYLSKIKFSTFKSKYPLTLIAISVACMMLLSGAFRTGETGRALMYLYPYLLLTLKDAKIEHIKFLFLACLFQSIIMQSFGFWSW